LYYVVFQQKEQNRKKGKKGEGEIVFEWKIWNKNSTFKV